MVRAESVARQTGRCRSPAHASEAAGYCLCGLEGRVLRRSQASLSGNRRVTVWSMVGHAANVNDLNYYWEYRLWQWKIPSIPAPSCARTA